MKIRSITSLGAGLLLGVLARSAAAQAPPEFHHLHGGELHRVVFVDANHGWTAEEGGRIRWTDDGGSTWHYAMIEDNDDLATGDRVVLNGLFFIPGDGDVEGWAVGEDGVVLKSVPTTYGQEWADANPNDRVTSALDLADDCGEHLAELFDIFMLNSDDGWAVGDDGALSKTADGGATWTPLASPPAAFACSDDPHDIYRIHFFEDPGAAEHYQKGILTSDFRKVYVTADGGDTWSAIDVTADAPYAACPTIPSGADDPSNNLELWSMSFEDPTNSTSLGWVSGGISTGNGYIYRTSGGGVASTWSQYSCYQVLDTTATDHICGLSTQYGVAVLGTSTPRAMSVGYGGEAYAFKTGTSNYNPCTCDVGNPCGTTRIWVQQGTLPNASTPCGARPQINDVARVTDTSASAVSIFGRILKYASGSFSDVASTYFIRLNDGAFVSASEGFVIGQYAQIKHTNDAGATWGDVTVDWNCDEYDQGIGIALSSTGQYGVAVGSTSFVAKSSNYGATWTDAVTKPGSLPTLNAVAYAPGTSTAYAVGGGGTVIKTTDDGATWSATTAAGSDDLFGLCFTSASTGFVVGANQKVYKTTNGGSTWTAVAVNGGAGETFHSIKAWSSGAHAIIVADNGGVFAMEGAATRFFKQSLGANTVSNKLLSVDELGDGDHVRVSGEDGMVLFRDLGTWSRPRSQTNGYLVKVSFDAADHGFLIGRNYVIVEYTD